MSSNLAGSIVCVRLVVYNALVTTGVCDKVIKKGVFYEVSSPSG